MYDETEQPLKPIKLGFFKGKIRLSDDFDEPLPDSFNFSALAKTSRVYRIKLSLFAQTVLLFTHYRRFWLASIFIHPRISRTPARITGCHQH